LADSFAQYTEDNWSFPISITLIKYFQQQDKSLVAKAEATDPTYTTSPFMEEQLFVTSQSGNPTTIKNSRG
jgi:hypothetical protein